MPLVYEPRDWQREGPDGAFVCSTNRKYIQVEALNAAFDSDMMWCAVPLWQPPSFSSPFRRFRDVMAVPGATSNKVYLTILAISIGGLKRCQRKNSR
jgi:hypothetical protein